MKPFTCIVLDMDAGFRMHRVSIDAVPESAFENTTRIELHCGDLNRHLISHRTEDSGKPMMKPARAA